VIADISVVSTDKARLFVSEGLVAAVGEKKFSLAEQ
jgi:hypothetical protein